MDTPSLMLTSAVLTILIAAIIALSWHSKSAPGPDPLPPVSDPALPEIQKQLVERLSQLPHFRRILDGSLFDYYRGARLHICTCEQLPYPHLLLTYGPKQGIVFQSAGALEHYVAVQEAVAVVLARPGSISSTIPSAEL